MTEMDRRKLLKMGAWAAPVIVLATAAPAAAATSGPQECQSSVVVYDPRTTPLNHGRNDVAKITIVIGEFILVEYIKDVDIVDINVRAGGATANTHQNLAPRAGHKITLSLQDCKDPEWIQVNGNNVHYYGNGVFA